MCCFVCSLKGQAKFLESKLNAFYGFDRDLRDFSLWLNKAETALQSFNDITEEALTPTGPDGTSGLWKPVRVDVSFDVVTLSSSSSPLFILIEALTIVSVAEQKWQRSWFSCCFIEALIECVIRPILRLMIFSEYCLSYLQKIQNEMDESETKLESLNSIGTQILIGLKTTEAKDSFQTQLNDVNQRWNQLKNKCKTLQKLELK